MRTIAACALASTLASSALATIGDLSPKDFDLACAVMASGWGGQSKGSKEGSAAFDMYSFYIAA